MDELMNLIDRAFQHLEKEETNAAILCLSNAMIIITNSLRRNDKSHIGHKYLGNENRMESVSARETFYALGHGFYGTRSDAMAHVPNEQIIHFREVIE